MPNNNSKLVREPPLPYRNDTRVDFCHSNLDKMQVCAAGFKREHIHLTVDYANKINVYKNEE